VGGGGRREKETCHTMARKLAAAKCASIPRRHVAGRSSTSPDPFICMHMYTYIHTYTHTHTHIHTYMHACMHTYIYNNIHAYIHTCAYVYSVAVVQVRFLALRYIIERD